MATQKDPTTFGYQNFYSTTLTGDITSSTLTIGLATVPTPTSGILVIEPDSTSAREIILYTSKGASTITCPSDGRGWSGTSASAHLTGSTVIMASVDEYFEGLADGTLSTDPLRSTLIRDHVVSGGVIAQSSGLIGTFSNIVFYLNGQRYSGSSIANKTYTASKDTYVDVTAASGGAVTVAYNEAPNGATAPTLAANYVRIAKVVTSGAAITSVTQTGNDNIGNALYAKAPTQSISLDLLSNLIVMNNPTTSNYGTTETALQSLTTTIPVGCTKVLVLGSVRLQSQDATNKDITARVDYDSAASTMTGMFTSVNTFNGAHVSIVDTIPVTAGSHTFRLLTRASNGAASTSNAQVLIIPLKG